LGDLGIDGRIILRWIFRKCEGGEWTGLIWLRIGTGEGACDCGNEPSGAIKCGEFLDWLGSCKLLKKDCAVWSYLVLA
jgi:hypothetical protein